VLNTHVDQCPLRSSLRKKGLAKMRNTGGLRWPPVSSISILIQSRICEASMSTRCDDRLWLRHRRICSLGVVLDVSHRPSCQPDSALIPLSQLRSKPPPRCMASLSRSRRRPCSGRVHLAMEDGGAREIPKRFYEACEDSILSYIEEIWI
jgi:hypothetical protein